jgi:hypothetical protein
MTYRPAETVFPPPWSTRIPSLIYLAIAIGVIVFVAVGYNSPTNSWIHEYTVERDVRRLMGSRMFASLIALSAFATVMRAGMRGVRIYPDGLEYRDVLGIGWPRVRRYRWAQIDGIVLDLPKSIALDLWDGTRAFLPDVGDRAALEAALEKVGAARAIPVRGGKGLDEIPDPESDDELAEES